MNILQDENSQTTYNKCKYKVKFWENEFKKKHRRLPSKLDIREASTDVRNAYKIYFRLKTAALEESLTNLEGFDVDKTLETNPPKENINQLGIDDVSKEEEPETINKVYTDNTWGLHLNKSTNFTVINETKQEKPNVNITFSQKLFRGSKSLKRLPRKSLSFTRKKTDVDDGKSQFLSQPEFVASNSFDLGEESQVEPNCRAIKNSLNESLNISQNRINNSFSSKPLRMLDQGWLERLTLSTRIDSNNEDLRCSKTDNVKSDYDSDDVIENSEDELDSSTTPHPVSKKIKVDKLASSTNTKKGKTEFVAVDETTKRLDFSNIFTKSCDSSRKKIESCSVDLKKSAIDGEMLGTSRRLEKKISSGTLNDNYIQINLKKKVYARGKGMNRKFSKFKHQQWRNKKKSLYGPDMDMGGCDGGMLTCFNCGQVGHFAKQCKSNKSDLLLPLTDLDKEDIYSPPTLEEASKMARESALCVRKPNQIKLSKNEEKGQLVNNELSENSAADNLFSDHDDDLLAETERLEREIAETDNQMFVDVMHTVRPYYEFKEDGSMIDCPQEVYDALNKFGYQTFRDGQQQAIMRILSGRSTLVTLSTGSGKSLCYQLPAYLYSKREPCVTLIISPLVSLMEDQVTGIPEFLGAACFHTYQTKIQKEKIMEMINTKKLDILLVSPEMIVAGEKSAEFGSFLRKLPPIAFACIDEAHCVSQWSHNFRPSYLKICKVLKDRLGVNTILGLTATATKITSDSIIKHFGITDGDAGIIRDIPLPDNLNLTISRDIQRDQALLSLLLSERFEDCKSVIIYCTRREECERVAAFLRTHLKNDYDVNVSVNKKRKRFSLLAEPYHAGLAAGRRRNVQKAFMKNELRIVVATVAFSMGINKPDLRAVIHYNMPMSFESYVQEVGRAGRDGLPAQCHLFLDSQGKDENELLRHVYANSIDRHVIRKLLLRCFIPCSCDSTCPRHEVAIPINEIVQALDVPEENIETLLCYLELHSKRYVELLSHAYITCKIISYGGPNEIKKAAKNCPPLAMALAMYGNKSEGENVFEFPIIEIASAIGWESGICKHKLKNLEWTSENNQPRRSKLSVQYSNLGFRMLSPGNLSDTELDEALDSLYERVRKQERMSILQLHEIYSSLTSVSAPSYKQCLSKDDFMENESSLKTKIRKYFSSSTPIKLSVELPVKPVKEELIVSDVRSLICMYRDNMFTGRAIARIFHGIQSPRYPAVIWGRCKFWRLHLGMDFNAICDIATKEILLMR